MNKNTILTISSHIYSLKEVNEKKHIKQALFCIKIIKLFFALIKSMYSLF